MPLTTHPSLNSRSTTYNHHLISSHFVSLAWLKCNCTAFFILFIYKRHLTPSNRLLLEMCFLDGGRVHENWLASVLLCYLFSVSLSHCCPLWPQECCCICLLLFLLCHSFFCLLTSLIISNLCSVYLLVMLFFILSELLFQPVIFSSWFR